MKVSIPESQKDITLEQYQSYEAGKEKASKHIVNFTICSFTEITEKEVDYMSQSDKEYLFAAINESLNKIDELAHIITIEGVDFGIIPNLDKDNVTGAEFTDMIQYDSSVKDLHRLMAILYRPVKNKDGFGNYEIEPYRNTSDHCDTMKKMSLSDVNGVLGFFLTLQKELDKFILVHSAAVQAKEGK